MATYEISKYQFVLKRTRLLGIGTDPETWTVAGIRCVQASSGPFLDIGFMPDGVPLPPNSSHGNYNIAFRPFSEFSSYIDLLRNEKPAYMYLFPDDPGRHGIGTSFEPIGEGEEQ